MRFVKYLFCFTLLLIGVSAVAAPPDVYVTFLATPTDPPRSPGHAFACIELKLNQGIKEDCFGFYPKSFKDILNGDGVVENELSRAKNPDRFSKVTVSLRHKIDEDIRRDIYTEVQKWSGANYDLIVHNCGDMVFAVAKIAGLVTPNRSIVLKPTEFVTGLKDSYWRGLWTTSDVGSRFSLVLEGEAAMRWTERNNSGLSISKVVPFSPKDAEATIHRDNTTDILEFLGFQQSLKAEITAAGPKPSYLLLRRQKRVIEAEWFGIIAIKDSKAHLKELKQPGTTPGKAYSFDRAP